MIALYALTVLLAIRASTIQGSTDWRPLASFLTLILLAASTALPDELCNVFLVNYFNDLYM